MKDLLKNRTMITILPFFIFGGVVIAIYTGIQYILIEKSLGLDSEKDKKEITVKTAYVFISLGISELFVGYISGKLV